MFSILGRKITRYTVIYDVYLRFWLTLQAARYFAFAFKRYFAFAFKRYFAFAFKPDDLTK
jgi:hypothetical protein